MSKVPKGMFQIEVDSGTGIGRKFVSIRPSKILAIETLVNLVREDGEVGREIQAVYYEGMQHPYKIEVLLDDLYDLINNVDKENDVKGDERTE